MAASDVLRQMINDSDDQVSDIESSIGQIDGLIDDTQTQIDGLEDGMCTPSENDLTTYLDGPKLSELELLYGPCTVSYGPNYGSIDYTDGGIIDWEVLDSTAGVVYKYLGVNWDGDATITKLIGDFDFANDYLTRPLTSGASYGLKPYKSNLNTAKSLLNQNKTKIADSKTALEDYAS